MPRIRSIKPEFWADFPTALLSRDARLLYIALWNFADEHGRLAGDPRFVKGQVFPYDDDLSAEAVDALLDELAEARNIVRYRVASAPYIYLPKLAGHQRLEPGKVPSRHPEPPHPDGPGPRGTHTSGPRADSSAPDAHQAERGPDDAPVDNPPGAENAASSQVSEPPQVGTHESARGADDSALLYAAGSMEHAAAAAATGHEDRGDDAPSPALAILRSKLNARKLIVRWDRLKPAQVTEIEALIQLHGDSTLVKTALQAFQPDNPPVFAQAWLENWRALPAPGAHLTGVADPACPEPGHSGTTRHCAQCASEQKAAR